MSNNRASRTDGFLPRPRELSEDMWALLRLAATEALAKRSGRVVVVSACGLKSRLGAGWSAIQPMVERHLRVQLEPLAVRGSVIVGYGPVAYVIISSPNDAVDAWRGEIEERIARQVPGLADCADAIEARSVQEIAGDGIWVEPSGKPSPAEGATSMPVPGPSAATDGRVILQDAAYTFDPLWDVRQNIVLGYHCRPHWDLGRGRAIEEEDLDDVGADPHRLYGMDIETLHKAEERLDDMIYRDSMGTLIIPIHWWTLVDEQAAANYFREIDTDPLLWSERVIFEILRAPLAKGASVLGLGAARLDRRGKGFLLRGDWTLGDSTGLGSLAPMGLMGVGIDVLHDHSPETEIMTAMDSFVMRMAAQGLPTYVLGLGTVSLSVAAVCAGFAYVGSATVSRSLEPWGLDDHIVKPIDLFREIVHGKK